MLRIHRAERADTLADALQTLLAAPLDDPFEPEVVAVPTRGIERWLSQRLSNGLGAHPGRGDGICANVAFLSPTRLVTAALTAATDAADDIELWLPEQSVWPLLQLIDALPQPIPEERRMSVMRHVAGLFDRYSAHRPDLIRAWADDDSDDAVPDDHAWQAAMWRQLRALIGTPSPAEALARACARIEADPAVLGLPKRLAMFGLTRLPAFHLALFRAIAATRDVHLYLLHPSPSLWDAVKQSDPHELLRSADTTRDLTSNTILASWGRDARELQVALGDDFADRHHDAAHASETMLGRLQAAVHANEPPSDLPPPDGTIQVHSCHGRGRQVEVLRDAILHALDTDPTLEPRDIIVMCPDIETFAPLIHATFGAGESSDDHEGVQLRVRLADRSLRQTNPILGAVSELLTLAGTRMTASQVLDFADRPPVRMRFRFDDDALGALREWVAQSGIRWGLDAQHRETYRLEAVPAGTWDAGLSRLLLGVAMTEDDRRLFGGALPLDDVDSGSIALAGRFAEFISRLRHAADSFAHAQTAVAWATAIAAAADALLGTTERDGWQRTELQRLLDDVVTEAAGSDAPLGVGEVRGLLADRLAGRPTRANFRTGALTVCTLMPMRSVPHRVICLMGLDDGAFPRKPIRDGDDVLLLEPRVGEQDPRSEDRQLLLDALLAATERLIVAYTGNDERTNERRPPAVPVGELLDVVGDGVVQRHPLQPFHPGNFEADDPWSFDPVMLDGATALGEPRDDEQPFLSSPLADRGETLVELDSLVRFVRHPARTFLRQRLGISLADYTTETEDDLRIELDGLQRWSVGQQLLTALLAGVGDRDACLAEMARGDLPPEALGRPVIDGVFPIAKAIADATKKLSDETPTSIDTRVVLPGDITLAGTVDGIRGTIVLTSTFSRVGPSHRLASWARLLALGAAHPEEAWTAATVGRGGDGIAVATIRMPDDPLAELTALVDLYERGMREPLPLACATSAAYAQASGDAIADARKKWESSWNFPGEADEPEHQLIRGGTVPFDDLLREMAAGDEQWDPGEKTRFGQLARRLWAGLLAHEDMAAG